MRSYNIEMKKNFPMDYISKGIYSLNCSCSRPPNYTLRHQRPKRKLFSLSRKLYSSVRPYRSNVVVGIILLLQLRLQD